MWNLNTGFENTLVLLELLSYIATIVGMVVVVIAVISFKKDSEKEHKENEQLLIKNSIDVLKSFSEKVIPDMEKAKAGLAEEIKKQKNEALRQINASLPEDKKLKKFPEGNKKLSSQVMFISMSKSNYGSIFNKLEQLTVYMNYEMVKEDLVYIPLHSVFLDFINENKEFLTKISTDDAPYINVLKLHKHWNDKNKVEKLEQKKKKVTEELNEMKLEK